MHSITWCIPLRLPGPALPVPGLALLLWKHKHSRPGFVEYQALTKPVHGCQVFYMPIVRHLYYWLGGRPAGKATVRAILARNGACVLIPGGVAEVTEIQHGSEVAFMKSRLGFVKLALESGTAVATLRRRCLNRL